MFEGDYLLQNSAIHSKSEHQSQCSVNNRMRSACRLRAVHCSADVVCSCHRQRCDQSDLCPSI